MKENQLTAAISFKVQGLLRFLSHQETSRMLRRAAVRAQLPLQYSEGFNPHPKMSLPLPRSVSMASEDELVLLMLSCEQTESSLQAKTVKDRLNNELPEGAEVTDAEIYPGKVKFFPKEITYLLPLDDQAQKQKALRQKQRFEAGEDQIIERTNYKTGKTKRVNLADFVKSITLDQEGVILTVKVENGSSIKLSELPTAAAIDCEIERAIVRKKIGWELKR